MGLTAEQQRLIDENRRKALERRAAKQSETSQVPQNQTVRNVVPSSNRILESPIVRNPQSSSHSPAWSQNFKGTPKQGSSKKPFSTQGNRPLVTFQLISKLKFVVEAPFDNEMVEVFKKIPSKSYDGASRKWMFALSDHQQLVDGLNPLLSKYQVQPLPRYVLDIFRYHYQA